MNLIEKLRDIHAVGRIADCGHSTDVCEEAADEIDRLRGIITTQQAKIDALMLEHCPEDMTDEQKKHAPYIAQKSRSIKNLNNV